MHFQIYEYRKRWLHKCLKKPASEDPSTSNMVHCPNTVVFWTTEPLPYFLIAMKVMECEKIYFSAMQSLKTVNTLTADDKYSLLNRDNLTQPIQIVLSQKEKTFSDFSVLSETYINFLTFSNKRWPS